MIMMIIVCQDDDNDDSYDDSNNCSRYSYLSNNIFLFSSISWLVNYTYLCIMIVIESK